jgi:hypothetical protein
MRREQFLRGLLTYSKPNYCEWTSMLVVFALFLQEAVDPAGVTFCLSYLYHALRVARLPAVHSVHGSDLVYGADSQDLIERLLFFAHFRNSERGYARLAKRYVAHIAAQADMLASQAAALDRQLCEQLKQILNTNKLIDAGFKKYLTQRTNAQTSVCVWVTLRVICKFFAHMNKIHCARLLQAYVCEVENHALAKFDVELKEALEKSTHELAQPAIQYLSSLVERVEANNRGEDAPERSPGPGDDSSGPEPRLALAGKTEEESEAALRDVLRQFARSLHIDLAPCGLR